MLIRLLFWKPTVVVSTPPTWGEPERDTRSVARAVLAALVKGGRKPADEDVTLFVSAQRPARGETGAARVVWYGYSTYDYNSDSLTYKACDGKGWFGC